MARIWGSRGLGVCLFEVQRCDPVHSIPTVSFFANVPCPARWDAPCSCLSCALAFFLAPSLFPRGTHPNARAGTYAPRLLLYSLTEEAVDILHGPPVLSKKAIFERGALSPLLPAVRTGSLLFWIASSYSRDLRQKEASLVLGLPDPVDSTLLFTRGSRPRVAASYQDEIGLTPPAESPFFFDPDCCPGGPPSVRDPLDRRPNELLRFSFFSAPLNPLPLLFVLPRKCGVPPRQPQSPSAVQGGPFRSTSTPTPPSDRCNGPPPPFLRIPSFTPADRGDHC